MSKDATKANAFLSYARFDDQHDMDALSELRIKLEGEIRMVTGKPFKIFQDKRDVHVGQNWRQRIHQTLDSVTLLIAVLTPSFFGSKECMAEVKYFLEREKKLKRDDLIVPIYYVDVPDLNGGDPGPDELFNAIRSPQRFDWRELRFESMGSTTTRRAVNRLALEIRDALDRFPTIRQTRPRKKAPVARPANPPAAGDQSSYEAPQPPHPIEQTTQTAHALNRPSGISEPRTLVVDRRRGPYNTLGAAISVANAGDLILVRPGNYNEGLVINKPLEIIGQGKPEEILVQAAGMNALVFRTTLGRVTNITLRQYGGGDYFAVDVAQGRLILENCRIESDSLAGIGTHGSGADPIVRTNVIHSCRQSGVVVFDNGRGTFEQNDIANNDICGVVVRDGGNPVLRGNQIHDNSEVGVQAERDALGRIEDNDIYKNKREGIVIKDQANPVIRLNTIYENSKAGIYVYDYGQGAVERNEIRDNQNSGIAIRTKGNPMVQRNRVMRNNGKGVWCNEHAMGVIENNDLRENYFGAFWKSDDSTTRYANNQE